jgi:hypothetical protein
MKKYFFFLICIGLTRVLDAQNVGIGTATPAEKLDVNGNINVTGTVKANGIDGLPNQVLMKNTSGNLVWGDLSEYKNNITFATPGTALWTVPAGVIKIMVEIWGGGGAATLYGGGGGGAYVAAIIPVTPGLNVSYTVGTGGSPVSSSTSSDGGLSGVSFGSFVATAYGGGGNTYTTFGNPAVGGNYVVSASLKSFYFQAGEAGGANKFEYYQSGTTAFNESQTGGKGGDAGNSINTGGKGACFVRNAITASIIYNLFPSEGKIPGGGGGGATTTGGGLLTYGGQGMVIIHY